MQPPSLSLSGQWAKEGFNTLNGISHSHVHTCTHSWTHNNVEDKHVWKLCVIPDKHTHTHARAPTHAPSDIKGFVRLPHGTHAKLMDSSIRTETSLSHFQPAAPHTCQRKHTCVVHRSPSLYVFPASVVRVTHYCTGWAGGSPSLQKQSFECKIPTAWWAWEFVARLFLQDRWEDWIHRG